MQNTLYHFDVQQQQQATQRNGSAETMNQVIYCLRKDFRCINFIFSPCNYDKLLNDLGAKYPKWFQRRKALHVMRSISFRLLFTHA